MIPYSWVSYCLPLNPPKGRWDQEYIRRLLEGDEWKVPGVQYVETPFTPGEREGKILIVPAGHYATHDGCLRRMLPRFRWALEQMDWALVILTSDETASFPIEKLADLPRVRWWVQLPDPERVYPPHTRFLGEGSPWSARQIADVADPRSKTVDVFFAGQNTHARRHVLVDALDGVRNTVCLPTAGFTQGLPRESYYELLAHAKLAPAPSGVCSQSSFRLYEALEAQAIPMADTVRVDGKVNGYWDFVHPNSPLHKVGSWSNVRDHIEVLLERNKPGGWERNVSIVSSWWQRAKRHHAWQLTDDIYALTNNIGPFQNDDVITVLIPTSPSPLHPSCGMLDETILSVRERLPSAEIFVMFDGVRAEQRKRFADYYEYVRRSCAHFNIAQDNILPIVHGEHMHQAMMTWDALKRVRSPFVMFVEHDTPLTGDIPFADILCAMVEDSLNVMRLHHETHVLDEHAHLYLESVPPRPPAQRTPYVRTMQWSQRPHIARTDFYRDMINRHFAQTSRTMIEDVMHGVTEAAWLERGVEAWEEWRIGLYAPAGSWVRSLHSNGRRDDPKYPMTFMYPGETPVGAPHPGTR